MQYDIVGFGVATLDLIMEVPSFPTPGSKRPILAAEYHGGGLTATALVAASKLGAKTWYGGVLGNNDRSDRVRKILTGFNVALPEVGLYPASAEPFLAHVYVDQQTGERTIFAFEFASALPVVNEETIKTTLDSKCLFVDQFYAKTLLPLYHLAKERRIPLVGDFEAVADSDAEEALSMVDHLILPRKFARQYTSCQEIERAVEHLMKTTGRQVAVVTDGANGAWYADCENRKVRHQAAYQVDVCDTTGCGDVFHGAYAAALVFGMTLPDRVRFASAAAACKATQKGGQVGAPTRNELDVFIAKQTAAPTLPG